MKKIGEKTHYTNKTSEILIVLFFSFVLRFHLFIHERHTERERLRQRENQGPHGEPNVEVDPGTPGSRPEPKADTQPPSHPGVPVVLFLYMFCESL